MSQCELTGKGPKVKNLVSHSNIKTKSRACANVQVKRLFSPTLKQFMRFKVATSTIRDIEHSGGVDKFILNQSEQNLSKKALSFRNRILRKLRGGNSAEGVKA